jgi:hypothetical protein
LRSNALETKLLDAVSLQLDVFSENRRRRRSCPGAGLAVTMVGKPLAEEP